MPQSLVMMFVLLLLTVYAVKFQADTVHKSLQSTLLTSEKEDRRNNGFVEIMFGIMDFFSLNEKKSSFREAGGHNIIKHAA